MKTSTNQKRIWVPTSTFQWIEGAVHGVLKNYKLIHSFRQRLPDSLKGSETIKIIAQAWNELSEDARNQYEKKAAKDRERYKLEMERWQAKIKKDGSDEQISELKKLKSKKK